MVNAASKVVFHNNDLPNDYYYGVFKPKKQRDNLEKFFRMFTQVFCITVNLVLSSHSKIPKLVFKTDYRLMQVKSIAGSILQYFQLSLSYHLSLRPLFFLFLSGRLRRFELKCYYRYQLKQCNMQLPFNIEGARDNCVRI